jgi:hypothetical protein
MRSFRLGAFLVLTLLVGIVAVVAYDFGVSAGTAEAAVAAGASVIYAPATISPLGLIIGGFFLLLFLGFLARVIAGPRRGWGPEGWHHGRHGRAWDRDEVPEPFKPVLERWHREAHGIAPGPQGYPGGYGATPPPPPPADRPPTGA